MQTHQNNSGRLKQTWGALLALSIVAQFLSLGPDALSHPSLLFKTIPGILFFGWFLMPLTFAHNVTGYTGETTADWNLWYIGGYWLLVLGLLTWYFRKRSLLIFALLALIILSSSKGCYKLAMQGG